MLFRSERALRLFRIHDMESFFLLASMKHPKVKKATLVDIDGKVIEYSKKYLPEIACELENPRVDVQVGDGFI